MEDKTIFRRIKLEKVKEEKYELTVDEAVLKDEGSYRVVLSTDTETVESSSTVTVTKAEVKPTFRKGLEDQNIPKGSKLLLQVTSITLYFRFI